MTKRTQHTHTGECQLCGRRKIAAHSVNSTVAKHGYTKRWNCFTGTCPGSDALPYELSANLLPRHAELAQERADRLAAYIESEKAANIAQPLRGYAIERYDVRSQLNYKTREVLVVFVEVEGKVEAYAQEDGRKIELRGRIFRYTGGSAIAEARHTQKMELDNAEYHIKQALEYKAWALKRYASWKPAKLKPVVTEKPAKPQAPTVDVKAAKVEGTFATKQARKDALDRISREFETTYEKIREMYLALSNADRTEQRTAVYYGCHNPHEFTAKRRAMVLEAFPQAADIVAELDQLVAARNAVKAAP